MEHAGPSRSATIHASFATRIAAALQADLGHNEFGQWSSPELQHTVIWALRIWPGASGRCNSTWARRSS